MLSDPDAGHYVKKTGTYSVLSGTGYTDTCVVDSWWGLPVYWDAVNASKNDNTIFQETTIQCMKSETHKPLFMVADAGPDSHTSNPVSYTHLRAHETRHDLVCRLLLEKKKKNKNYIMYRSQ